MPEKKGMRDVPKNEEGVWEDGFLSNKSVL